MKSRFTHPLTQVVLTSVFCLVTSIACSASRSATPPAPLSDTATTVQSATPQDNSAIQNRAACTLNMSQAPVMKGLKLGMTQDEVLALFAGSKNDAEVSFQLARPPSQFGTSSLTIRPEKYENKADFDGISQITFSLLDGRVSSFTFNYSRHEWPDVDKFVEKFVEETALPAADQWEPYVGLENQLKVLVCADFEVRVFAARPGVNVSYVSFKDLDADKKLKDRRKKARKQASPTPGNQ